MRAMNAMSRIPHHPEVTNVFEVLTSSAQQVDILAADTIIQVVLSSVGGEVETLLHARGGVETPPCG